MEFQREVIVLFDRVQIRYYGIIIVAAMLVAAAVAVRLARRDGRDPDHVWGALTWAIIPGIILARLWFITFPPANLVAQGFDAAYYYRNFFNLENGGIAIWSGGLHIFGALLGGFLGALAYFRLNRLAAPAWFDIAGITLPLGQAIGRFANYVNQELYGDVTTLPWGILIERAKRVFPYESTVEYPVNTTRFHPLFLYESLWSLAAFVVLFALFSRNRNRYKPGDFALLYIVQYSVIRFLLEFLRLETIVVGNVNLIQVLCIIAFVLALGYFVYRHRPGAPTYTRDMAVDAPTPPVAPRKPKAEAA